MVNNQLPLTSAPIQFGTDGWRGVLGVDFTLERLLLVAASASQELAFRAPMGLKNKKLVIIGYDRRFLAAELAEAIASAVRGCGLNPLLTSTSVPTPACSWAVVRHKALGSLVITASHNPPEWLGLKIKGPNGASVDRAFTEAVEKRLLAGGVTVPIEGIDERFDARDEHLEGLRKKFDMSVLKNGLKKNKLKVIVDPMHGSAAGCISQLFTGLSEDLVEEIRNYRDTLFGGNPPEPLEPYLTELIDAVKVSNVSGKSAFGLVFDGDGDRLAAVDEKGRFCSTQVLMPLLIDHLARVRKWSGCVIKTVSGSDLMELVAKDYGLEVIELPVGFKYIAAEMLCRDVMIGGEESGGIGFGCHLPERDALFAALLLIEALTEGNKLLGERLDELNNKFGPAKFARIDLSLPDMDSRLRFESVLESSPPDSIVGYPVQEVITKDGVKLRLGERHWLMFRFSGTEPLLRIYSEAPNNEDLLNILTWAKNFAEGV